MLPYIGSMNQTPIDYAVYGNQKFPITHRFWQTTQSLGDFLYRDANDGLRESRKGMAFHHVADRKFITMMGPPSKDNDALWSWRLLELRGEDEGGHPMTPAQTFDSVPERHYAPVVFMDLDTDSEITLTAFRPKDRIHYPLSMVGYEIQREIIRLAEVVGKGDMKAFALDS